jgi:hypothetical protein
MLKKLDTARAVMAMVMITRGRPGLIMFAP